MNYHITAVCSQNIDDSDSGNDCNATSRAYRSVGAIAENLSGLPEDDV